MPVFSSVPTVNVSTMKISMPSSIISQFRGDFYVGIVVDNHDWPARDGQSCCGNGRGSTRPLAQQDGIHRAGATHPRQTE
jgi:hypothetical protein